MRLSQDSAWTHLVKGEAATSGMWAKAISPSLSLAEAPNRKQRL